MLLGSDDEFKPITLSLAHHKQPTPRFTKLLWQRDVVTAQSTPEQARQTLSRDAHPMEPAPAPTIDHAQIKSLSMLVVMGATGTGKSHFINQLAGQTKTPEGEDLESCELHLAWYPPLHVCTSAAVTDRCCTVESRLTLPQPLGTYKCKPVLVEVGRKPILMVDTPGFDDTRRTDTEILAEIASILAAAYTLGVPLRGVVYMHRITDRRFTAGDVKTFEIFKRICGDAALANVMLVTSMWGQEDEGKGARRERDLREEFWSYLLERGSRMNRFYGNRGSAVALISQLLNKAPTVLSLQLELVKERKKLKETAAGGFVHDELEDRRRSYARRQHKQGNGKGGARRTAPSKRNSVKEKRAPSTNERDFEKEEEGLNRFIAKEVDDDVKKFKQILVKSVPYILPLATFVLHILFGVIGIPQPLPL